MKELGERKLGVQKQAVSSKFLEPGEKNCIVNSLPSHSAMPGPSSF